MLDLDVIDTRRMPDGTEYRVSLTPDTDAGKPEDDGGWPILRLEWIGYQGRWTAEAFNSQAEPYADKFNELANGGHSTEIFERYLRIFQGTTQVRSFGANDSRATDYNYIAFDTTAWHEAMGFLPNNVEALATERPLYEIQAWIEGDVYGWVTEKRWNPDEELEGDEGWEGVESVWGYYGRDYAESTAREQLEELAKGHKIVHRYAEHEKLTKHQSDFLAIMEFLEGLDGSDMRLAKLFPRAVHEPHMQSVPQSHHERIVMEHFGIDHSKIQQERALMVHRLQEEAKTQ